VELVAPAGVNPVTPEVENRKIAPNGHRCRANTRCQQILRTQDCPADRVCRKGLEGRRFHLRLLSRSPRSWEVDPVRKGAGRTVGRIHWAGAQSADVWNGLGNPLQPPAPTSKLQTDPARMASATFDFSHPSNLNVNHPVSPVNRAFTQYDG
jgi:hypothetical protein